MGLLALFHSQFSGSLGFRMIFIAGSDHMPIVWGAMLLGLWVSVAIASFVGSLGEACLGTPSSFSLPQFF